MFLYGQCKTRIDSIQNFSFQQKKTYRVSGLLHRHRLALLQVPHPAQTGNAQHRPLHPADRGRQTRHRARLLVFATRLRGGLRQRHEATAAILRRRNGLAAASVRNTSHQHAGVCIFPTISPDFVNQKICTGARP